MQALSLTQQFHRLRNEILPLDVVPPELTSESERLFPHLPIYSAESLEAESLTMLIHAREIFHTCVLAHIEGDMKEQAEKSRQLGGISTRIMDRPFQNEYVKEFNYFLATAKIAFQYFQCISETRTKREHSPGKNSFINGPVFRAVSVLKTKAEITAQREQHPLLKLLGYSFVAELETLEDTLRKINR